MVMRHLLAWGLGLWLWQGGVLAADLALILDTRAGQERRSAVAFDPGAALAGAGYEVLVPEGDGIAPLRAAALDLEARVAGGEVARLVILIGGDMAGDGQDSWLLPAGTGAVSRLRVGAAGLSVNALSAIAGMVEGPALLLIAPEAGAAGAGLSPGLAGFAEAAGVSYATGPRAALAALLDGPLLAPGTSLAEAARAAPEGVVLSGALPGDAGLVGPEPQVVPEAQLAEAREDGFWQAVGALDTQAAYEAYLAAWPEGRYRAEAQARRDWLRAEPERVARAAEAALGLDRAARRDVQRWLAVLGHYGRGIDGIFGRGTRGAIDDWQAGQGIEPTGYLDRAALARLRAQAADRQREIDEEERRARADEDRRDAADRAARADWDAAQEADTAEAYAAFLRDHPDSRMAEEARARLDALEEGRAGEEVLAQAREEERIYAGAEVVRVLIERRLAQIGAEPGPVDGRFTEETRDAIRRFQSHRGLPVTGHVSQATAAALMGMR
jgi:peptidoglycan hydrolase-like protein with peptidoglycan-binding domain